MTPTHNAWVQTHSGVALDLLEPKPEMFNINDIALGLSRVPRWGGQTARFMSVAEHSLRVADHTPPAYALAALLHDASEAYTGDLATPLKALCPGFMAVEARLQAAIYEQFLLPLVASLDYVLREVAEVDARQMATEYRDLHPHTLFKPELLPFNGPIGTCMDPASAEVAFLERFWALYGGGDE